MSPNHRIRKWFGLEGAFEGHLVSFSAVTPLPQHLVCVRKLPLLPFTQENDTMGKAVYFTQSHIHSHSHSLVSSLYNAPNVSDLVRVV